MVGYDPEAPLFRCPDLDLRRGECVALLGPNGSGKTTFLKTILGEIEPLAGYARLGASLKIGYFAQVHADLDPDKSVLDTILEVKNLPLGEARSFLARFLFTGDDVFKPIGELSGGERSRVALARLVLQRANFLLLDEPTNHLDIASQEVLEEVLDDFEGTIVLVTHDRYLVDRLATQLWIIDPKEQALDVFRGHLGRVRRGRRTAERRRPRPARPRTSGPRSSARPGARSSAPAARRRPASSAPPRWRPRSTASKPSSRRYRTRSTRRREAQEAMRLHELGTLYGELEGQLQAADRPVGGAGRMRTRRHGPLHPCSSA